jgi:hypothetical protein
LVFPAFLERPFAISNLRYCAAAVQRAGAS